MLGKPFLFKISRMVAQSSTYSRALHDQALFLSTEPFKYRHGFKSRKTADYI